MKLRILIASFPAGQRRLAAILAGHDLVIVRTMSEAQAALAGHPFDLTLIGTRFDESRMFDLLRHIKSSEKTAAIPVVCFRGLLARLASDKVVVEGLSLGCQALGAVAFHDFIDYPDDEAGNKAIRQILESYAVGSK